MQNLAITIKKEKLEGHEVLLDIVTSLGESYTCEFCTGWGHAASRCTTKKNLDKNMKNLGKSMKWGHYKSTLLVKGMAKRKIANKEAKKNLRDKVDAEVKRLEEELAEAQRKEDEVAVHKVPQGKGANMNVEPTN